MQSLEIYKISLNNYNILQTAAEAKPDEREISSIRLVRLIYIKFLNKLFKLNLRNLNHQNSHLNYSSSEQNNSNLFKQMSSSTSSTQPSSSSTSSIYKQASNHLFIEQFKLIVNGKQAIEFADLLVKMVVTYLFNFGRSFKFFTAFDPLLSNASMSTIFKSSYYSSTSGYAFGCLLELVNVTQSYVFDNILLLDNEDVRKKKKEEFLLTDKKNGIKTFYFS